jgi:hypothetical protein
MTDPTKKPSEPPIQKPEDPYAWGTFFEKEFQNLKIKTGILQYEKFQTSEGGHDAMNELSRYMVLECKTPPYDQIDKQILQRVISAAVVDDKDFIGFSVKFIRKTLNTWWQLYGWKIMEKMQREKEEQQSKQVPPAVDIDVDTMLESYKRRLLLESAKMKEIPKMKADQIQKEGAEWKSTLERKGLTYSNGLTPEYVELKARIQRTATKFYEKRSSYSDLKLFPINDFEIFAASEKDASEIYSLAIKKD